MIRKLHINNYKSILDLTLEVGRFNVLIGENGCGKSNVLEAITFAAAAAADKLDNEFLGSRGIRVTDPQLMRSAFSNEYLQEPIEIGIGFENLEGIQKYFLINENTPYTKWTRKNLNLSDFAVLWKKAFELEESKSYLWNTALESAEIKSDLEILTNELSNLQKQIINITAKELFENNELKAEDFLLRTNIQNDQDRLKNFIIYSPENTALRNFFKEGQIEPLGINGEGLFKLLKVIQSKSAEQRQEIHNSLQLFDWYSELDIPQDLSPSEDKVTITDRYLALTIDQRSANEGFLFVLFYIALMVSDDTPKIFAIDNIDTSLNPKLCTKLIKELVRLAKKYNKQVFVTTHNPAILDGIDLGDEEQHLLVVSRNKLGYTRIKRITLEDKPKSSSNEDLKLSEAFLRGYLGGLPKGF